MTPTAEAPAPRPALMAVADIPALALDQRPALMVVADIPALALDHIRPDLPDRIRPDLPDRIRPDLPDRIRPDLPDLPDRRPSRPAGGEITRTSARGGDAISTGIVTRGITGGQFPCGMASVRCSPDGDGLIRMPTRTVTAGTS